MECSECGKEIILQPGEKKIIYRGKLICKECFERLASPQEKAEFARIMALYSRMQEAKQQAKESGTNHWTDNFLQNSSAEELGISQEEHEDLKKLLEIKKNLKSHKCQICGSEAVNWVDGQYLCSEHYSAFGKEREQEEKEELLLEAAEIRKSVFGKQPIGALTSQQIELTQEAVQIQQELVAETAQQITELMQKLAKIKQEEAAEKAAENKCPECGSDIQPNWPVCPACGASLKKIEKEEKKVEKIEKKEESIVEKELQAAEESWKIQQDVLAKQEAILAEEKKIEAEEKKLAESPLPPEEKKKEQEKIVKETEKALEDIREVAKEVKKAEKVLVKEEKAEKKLAKKEAKKKAEVGKEKTIKQIMEAKRRLFEKIKEFPEDTPEQMQIKIGELAHLLKWQIK